MAYVSQLFLLIAIVLKIISTFFRDKKSLNFGEWNIHVYCTLSISFFGNFLPLPFCSTCLSCVLNWTDFYFVLLLCTQCHSYFSNFNTKVKEKINTVQCNTKANFTNLNHFNKYEHRCHCGQSRSWVAFLYRLIKVFSFVNNWFVLSSLVTTAISFFCENVELFHF